MGGDRLGLAVETLQRVRYSPEAENWEGTVLWEAYETMRRSAASGPVSPERSVLPALYPEREPSNVLP